jgi:NADPH-dependent ferric siderophore reductase
MSLMPRSLPVPITVTDVIDLAPRARRIRINGMTLIESLKPASYLSLSFTDPGEPAAAPDASERRGRSDRRTFTPRWLDEQGSMTVDFVLHGSGPASTWAEGATVGDVIWAGPTKGGYDIPPPGSTVVLIGDDTAIPAMGTILEALTDSVRVTAIIEVIDANDEREVTAERLVDPIWIHRGSDPGQTGVLTANLIDALEVANDSYWWVAGERAAVISLRDKLRETKAVPKERLSINAHWRLQATDPRRR